MRVFHCGLQLSDITHRELVSASCRYPFVQVMSSKGGVEGRRRIKPVLYSPFWKKKTKQRRFRRHPAASGGGGGGVILAKGGNPPSFIPNAEHWSCRTKARRRCGSVPLLHRCPHGNSNEAVDARALGRTLHGVGEAEGDYVHQLLDWLQCAALEDRRQARVSQTHTIWRATPDGDGIQVRAWGNVQLVHPPTPASAAFKYWEPDMLNRNSGQLKMLLRNQCRRLVFV